MRRAIDKAGAVLERVTVALVCLFLVAPIIALIFMSLDSRAYLAPFPPPSLSLRWYAKLLHTDLLLKAAGNTALIAATATATALLIGVPAGLALSGGHWRGRNLLTGFLMSPLAIPGVVLGFCMLLFWAKLQFSTGFLRLYCAHTVLTLPFILRAVMGGTDGLNRNLASAAESLGATPTRSLVDITLPLIRANIVAGVVFAIAFSIDEIAVSLFLTDPNITTLPVAMVSLMRSSFDLSVAAAAVALMVTTVLALLVLHLIFGMDRILGRGQYG
ncbi:MAG: ABC transporter permease [Pseudomonadota bacterium]